jgi:thiamine-phosphate pyrophosphorylase
MNPNHAPLRILDASLNRATEGLRVVEDYVRFVLDDAHLTEQFKRLRHDLAAAGGTLPLPERHAVRDTQQDVGTAVTTPSEARRADAWDVCVASFERVKQSLRSLEEFGKVVAPELGAKFEAIRYRLYTLEAATGRTVDAVERLANVRLYVLIDGHDSEADFTALVQQLVAAEVGVIQLRDKRLNDQQLIRHARLLQSCALQPRALPGGCSSARNDLRTNPRPEAGAENARPLVIINDRPDVAAIVDADGVHLGQDDMSVKDARAIVGPRRLIGVSTHSIDQARAAVLAGANYIGVGPTFPSTTKNFDAFPGVGLLQQIAAEVRLPAFAIGGITARNVDDILATGIERIAVSSAITESPTPQTAAAELLKRLGASPVAAG